MDHSPRRAAHLAWRWSVAALVVASLGACSDGSISSESDPASLRADVVLRADLGARTASAYGTADFTDFTSFEGVRLVDGDRLVIGWNGAEYRLLRRDAPYFYERRFFLPAGRELEAGFRIVSGGRGTIRSVPAHLPDVASFELLEQDLSVASDASLNLLWNLDLDDGTAPEQVLDTLVVELSPVACTDAAGLASSDVELVGIRVRTPLPSEATTASLSLTDVFRPARATGADRCRYAVRLEATAHATGTTGDGPALELRTVTISAPAYVDVVAVNGTETGP